MTHAYLISFAAMECNEDPPWLRETSRSMSYPASTTSSYPSLSSVDTSSEMGPQTLPSMSSLPPSFSPSTSSKTSDQSMQPSSTTQSSSSTASQTSSTTPTSQASCDPNDTPTSGSSSLVQSKSPQKPAGGDTTKSAGGSDPECSGQPAAHILPPYRPKLDQGKTSAAPSAQLLYSGSGGRRDVGISATKSGAAAVVMPTGGILWTGGMNSIALE